MLTTMAVLFFFSLLVLYLIGFNKNFCRAIISAVTSYFLLFLLLEDHVDQMPHPSSGRFPTYIPWHPGFCVARTDERSLICYRNEQVNHTYLNSYNRNISHHFFIAKFFSHYFRQKKKKKQQLFFKTFANKQWIPEEFFFF